MFFGDSDTQRREGLSEVQKLFFEQWDRRGARDISFGKTVVRWASFALLKAPRRDGPRLLPTPIEETDAFLPAANVDGMCVATFNRPKGAPGSPIRRNVTILGAWWDGDTVVFGGKPSATHREYDLSICPRHPERMFEHRREPGRLESPIHGKFRFQESELWRDLVVLPPWGLPVVAFRIPQDQVSRVQTAVIDGAEVRRGDLLATVLEEADIGVAKFSNSRTPRVRGTGELMPADREELCEAAVFMLSQQNELAINQSAIGQDAVFPGLYLQVPRDYLTNPLALTRGMDNQVLVNRLITALGVEGEYFVRARFGGEVESGLEPAVEGAHLRQIMIGGRRQVLPETAILLPSAAVGCVVKPNQPIANACERMSLRNASELEDMLGYLNVRETLADYIRQQCVMPGDSGWLGPRPLLAARYFTEHRDALSLQDAAFDVRGASDHLVSGIYVVPPVTRDDMNARQVITQDGVIWDFTPQFEMNAAPHARSAEVDAVSS